MAFTKLKDVSGSYGFVLLAPLFFARWFSVTRRVPQHLLHYRLPLRRKRKLKSDLASYQEPFPVVRTCRMAGESPLRASLFLSSVTWC